MSCDVPTGTFIYVDDSNGDTMWKNGNSMHLISTAGAHGNKEDRDLLPVVQQENDQKVRLMTDNIMLKFEHDGKVHEVQTGEAATTVRCQKSKQERLHSSTWIASARVW